LPHSLILRPSLHLGADALLLKADREATTKVNR